MAYNFPQGFQITGSEPIDTRLVLTKAEMLNIKKPNMPSVYFCICSDDGCLYLYNKENTLDEVTGRFRLFSPEAEELLVIDGGDLDA